MFHIVYMNTGQSCNLPIAPAKPKNPAPKRPENPTQFSSQTTTKINDDYLPPKKVLR